MWGISWSRLRPAKTAALGAARVGSRCMISNVARCECAITPQFPNKFPPALMRDRFCGVRRLRLSQVRVAGHLRTFVVAHGESRWYRILPERVAPPSRAHGASPPFQGTALAIALRVGNARFSLIRPVHAPAPAASGERRGSSPAPRLRRPVE